MHFERWFGVSRWNILNGRQLTWRGRKIAAAGIDIKCSSSFGNRTAESSLFDTDTVHDALKVTVTAATDVSAVEPT